MTRVHDYIERRIRRPIPGDSHIVPGSTPVVSFGDARSASVATLGLNPSRIEFLDSNGQELVGSSRRLATHRSLGTSDLANADHALVAQVLDDCNSYFDRQPYREWFDQLDLILQACGVSYYGGSACHLDLVQWATDPTWARLRPATVRNRLLEADASFLVEQLSNEKIRLLLVNGMEVVRNLRRTMGASFDELDPIVGLAYQNTRLFGGTILDRVRVIAWNTNLQSSFGVTTALRAGIADRVAELSGRS
jgi:hypothetical protein